MNVQGQYDSGRGRDGLGNVFNAGWTGDPPIRGGPLAAIRPWKAPFVATGRLTSEVRGPGPIVKRPPHITGDPGRINRNRKVMPFRRRKISPAVRQLNRAKFLTWLKGFSPGIATAAAKHANAATQAAGLGAHLAPSAAEPIVQPAATGWFDSFLTKAGEFGSQFLAFRTQKEILDIQIARAEAGLPPLETSQLAPTIKVEASPEATRQVTGAIADGLKKLAIPIMIGIGLIFFVKK